MSIILESPQIKALRNEVEKRVGSINTHNNFAKLETQIEIKCKEHVSITTLERIWGYSTRNANNVSERILDIIARFVDAKSWEDFCSKQSGNKESMIFENKDIINCDNLKKGTRIRLAWQPDRVCEIEYLGDYRFVAVRTENSTIKAGDTFRCLQIQKGRELHMDNFTRYGQQESNNARYIVGETNGLSVVEYIDQELE